MWVVGVGVLRELEMPVKHVRKVQPVMLEEGRQIDTGLED